MDELKYLVCSRCGAECSRAAGRYMRGFRFSGEVLQFRVVEGLKLHAQDNRPGTKPHLEADCILGFFPRPSFEGKGFITSRDAGSNPGCCERA